MSPLLFDSTAVEGAPVDTPMKVSLHRADEADDLLDAVKALIIPYIRSADDAAAYKGTGSTGKHKNVLVESYSPQDLLSHFAFDLPRGEGRGKDGLLQTIEDVLRYSVNTWDQGFMDKLTASTNPVGLISELVLGVLNTNVHVFHVSPALTVVEKTTARTLASYFGFNSPHAGGITCSGGSASNFTSLVIVRNTLYPESKVSGAQKHQFAVFTSIHGHFSIEKAAVACGMGSASVVGVPVNGLGQMKASALRELVSATILDGKTPLYVNATAGTTVYGAYDPIREIKAVCIEYGLWLHVDGSWGGSIAFSSKHKHKLDGTELADSPTINPQKMLGVPMTCSFLLTNDLRSFHTANSLRAEYLFHDRDDDEVWDLADLTLQCGRRADSLKLALAWVFYGARGFEKDIEHAFDVADHLAAMVEDSDNFHLISRLPSSSLQVCFYFAPNGVLSNDEGANTAMTKEMVRRMLPRGFMFDFAPGPNGYMFRVVVNSQTLTRTVDSLFSGLQEVGRDLVVV
jgi:glutamate decarboxylase